MSFAAMLHAQAPPASPAPQPGTPTTGTVRGEAQTSLQKFIDTVDVRVINIDVVVTDKKGNVVHGLKKDDFLVYENGIPKSLSNFAEIEGTPTAPLQATATGGATTAAPAPAPQRAEIPEASKRRIIFFIDNLSLAPFNRNRVFADMKDFIRNVMRPGDEAMIATFNRSMKVRVPFTRDTTQLIQTLDIIAGESGMGGQVKSERDQVQQRIRDARSYDEALADARSYAQSVDHDLHQTVESLKGLMTTLAGVDGKKALVITSEGFPLQPGKDAFYFIDDQAKEKGWQASSSMLEGPQFDATGLIESIAATANANGITLYPVHAGGLSAGSENSAENAHPISFSVSQATISNSTDSLQIMAEETGGIAALQTNNYKGAFERIRKDLDSYYSLGYRAGTERVDRQRRLEVRLKERNYTARARQSFVEKSTFADMSDRVIANLLYQTKSNDMKILMRLDTPKPTDDGLFKVPVEVQIPMENITLVPQGEDQYVGGFDVFLVVANKDGDMSDVGHRTNQIHVSKADMPHIAGKYYAYDMELLMESGLNKISLGVVDQISNAAGFARDQRIVRDLR